MTPVVFVPSGHRPARFEVRSILPGFDLEQPAASRIAASSPGKKALSIARESVSNAFLPWQYRRS